VNFDDRVKAIAEFGFTDRQARFLVTVMLHSGVCVPRQYAKFAGIAYGHKVSKFFDRLERRGFAIVSDCVHNRARLYHVRHHTLYRAICQPHSRYRRPVAAGQALERLMRLDAIVLFPDLLYLATGDEKVAFFEVMAPSLPREQLPHMTAGTGTSQRMRFFPDDQPIAVTSTGRVVFTYLVTSPCIEELRAFVQRHADLLRALPGWTLRVVFPEQMATAIAAFEETARYELTATLRTEMLAQLKRYFDQRRRAPNPRARTFEDEEFSHLQAAFDTSRFRQLYRRWLRDGDTVLEALSSTAIAEKLNRGTGGIESHVIVLSYRHLSPLDSLFRSCRKGGEGVDEGCAPPQPHFQRSRSARVHVTPQRSKVVHRAEMRHDVNDLRESPIE
jgi:hypothetical protein